MLVFRLLRKHLSLRIVNLVGLSIVLTSLLVSFNHIKKLFKIFSKVLCDKFFQKFFVTSFRHVSAIFIVK